jgi:hypothetical protein
MTSRMKPCLMLLFIAAAMTVIEAQIFTYSRTPTPATQQTPQQVAASLQLYADPLPRMPTIYGFSLEGQNPVSVNLTIGMYQTQWVIF